MPEYEIKVDQFDVTVDGDGEVSIEFNNYRAGTDYIAFTIEELEIIIAQAKAHRDAYATYRQSDYDEDAYVNPYVDPTI